MEVALVLVSLETEGHTGSLGIFAAAKMAYLSHDETVPKMGHPG